jgi:tetratricopeptide (TPR) repeat protein
VGRRVALLNLSGVGAGFFHLRSWVLFGINLAVTIGLLVAAAVMGAADNLLTWAPALLAWVLLTVVIGLFVGRQHERRLLARGEQPAVKGKPVILAACLVVAMILSLVGVWQTGEWRLRVADAAHARGDCDTAIDAYGQVESGFQLSMSPSLMNKARAGSEACQLLARAQRDVASESYDHAIDSYTEYFAHEASRWEDTDGSVAEIHFNYAGQLAIEADELFAEAEVLYADELITWANDGFGAKAEEDEEDEGTPAEQAFFEAQEAYHRAQMAYDLVAEEFSDTEFASDVPTALVDFYDEATADYADENWCTAFVRIGLFDNEKISWEAAPEIAERIEAEHPDAALKCGWAQLDSGELEDAEKTVEYLEASFPGHDTDDIEELERYIGAGYIEREMDQATLIDSNDIEGSPYETGGGDKVSIQYVNYSDNEMRFLYLGPDGVHGEVTIDPCEDCDTSSPPTSTSCLDDPNAMDLELDPGKYRVLIGSTGGSIFDRPLEGEINMKAGDVYADCIFISSD